jgi:hypothetical protein
MGSDFRSGIHDTQASADSYPFNARPVDLPVKFRIFFQCPRTLTTDTNISLGEQRQCHLVAQG